MCARSRDAFITVHPGDIEYVTGLTWVGGCLVVAGDGRATLFVDEARWNGTVAAGPHADLEKVGTADSLAADVAQYCAAHELYRLACEDLPWSFAEYLQRVADVTIERSPGVLAELRRAKDEHEQDALRNAASLVDRAMDVARNVIRQGVSELEVAGEIDRYVKTGGGDGTWFPTVVNSGARAAFPVYPATRKVIEAGDLVVVDIGPRWDGYCADLTRTFIVCPAATQSIRILDAVIAAQSRALVLVASGMPTEAVDRGAREVFNAAGFGEYVTHATGHGLGLGKEPPTIASGVPETFVPGECVTIEPGIYLPGLGGARIEDEVLVHEASVEILTRAPKDLDWLIVQH